MSWPLEAQGMGNGHGHRGFPDILAGPCVTTLPIKHRPMQLDVDVDSYGNALRGVDIGPCEKEVTYT
jgi:hypothetical protein